MKSTYGLAALSLLALSGAVWCAASRAQQEPPSEGVATKAGEKLDELGRAIKQGLVDAEDTVRDGLNKTGETVRDGLNKTGESVRNGLARTSDSVREGFTKTRESVQGMGLVPRVYGRLHWDKTLHSSTLLVRAEGGTVIIRGLVPDEAAKAKAVALVKDTVGVTQVIVQLSVMTPTVGTTNASPKR
jgi:hypothetical protein